MKNFMAFVRSILSNRVFMNVVAEENLETSNGNNPESTSTNTEVKTEQPTETKKEDPKPSGNVNFEELIAKARKEERDKLYPQLEKLKEKNNNLLLVVEERDKELASTKAELETLRKNADKLKKDVEEGTKTNKTVSQLTTNIALLERQLEELQAKYDNDINSLTLEMYKKEKIAGANDIIPELVNGSTQEEIDAAIELSRQRFKAIEEQIIGSVQMPTANPSSNVMTIGKDMSMDDIANMPPEQWAEVRKKMGLV